jgi:hypothetical protein
MVPLQAGQGKAIFLPVGRRSSGMTNSLRQFEQVTRIQHPLVNYGVLK